MIKRHEKEDYEHMRTLVLTRMAECYPLKKEEEKKRTKRTKKRYQKRKF